MDHNQFQEWLSGVDELSQAQKQQVQMSWFLDPGMPSFA